MKKDYINKQHILDMDDKVRDMLTDIVRTLTKHKITVIPVSNVMHLLGVSLDMVKDFENAYLSIDDKGELDCHELPEGLDKTDDFDGYDVISTTLH